MASKAKAGEAMEECKFEYYGGGEPFEALKDNIMLKLNKMEESEKLECEDKQSRGEDLEDFCTHARSQR